ncbi:MAG TPA: choice-of-anchor tandem repeat GloVer-containing protein, partial [Methylocella sp.]|nr:choice-of-anchor tandem repeat GloVer-containing protein [Methylocella sp.]
TETVLYSFKGGSDGINPYAGLIADKEGALYGTTYKGGTGGGYGTVFKLTPPDKGQTAWTETVLYSFKGGSDGINPYAGLIADKDGALYGTTYFGGTGGYGTVFKLTPPAKGQTAWTPAVLYSFKGSDGAYPYAGLIADKEGALYGTTFQGGAGGCQNGCGTVFKLTPAAKGQTAWTETVLRSFCSQPTCSGAYPYASLIADKESALYGTTYGGAGEGFGTVFKLTRPAMGQTAWTESALYSFKGGSDGASPRADLIADKNAVLYSTTIFGGGGSCQYGCGTVFKLDLCPKPKLRDRHENDEDHDHNGCPVFVSEE